MEGIVELTNFSLYYNNSVDEKALGAIAYCNRVKSFHGSLVHDFEINVVAVYEGDVLEPSVQHCYFRGERCQLLSISLKELERGLMEGCDDVLLKCLLEGNIIKDSDGRLAQMRSHFLRFSGSLREEKLFKAFARFMQKYVDAKTHMKHQHVLDAYQSILGGLHHWAEVELIERGIHPETAVWEQVVGLNTPVRKLYEELTESTETLGQRIELVLLACEFYESSKMADCSAVLLRILRSRRQPWTIQELLQHTLLGQVQAELPLILRKLVGRSLVKETGPWKEPGKFGCEYIRYYAE